MYIYVYIEEGHRFVVRVRAKLLQLPLACDQHQGCCVTYHWQVTESEEAAGRSDLGWELSIQLGARCRRKCHNPAAIAMAVRSLGTSYLRENLAWHTDARFTIVIIRLLLDYGGRGNEEQLGGHRMTSIVAVSAPLTRSLLWQCPRIQGPIHMADNPYASRPLRASLRVSAAESCRIRRTTNTFSHAAY